MMPGVETMARPKKGSKKVDRAPEERVAIIHLKGSQDYAAWLEERFRETHIAKATIVRLALTEWAERHGYPAPPEL